jgi:apolipoprotein N-acyltransferase
LVTVPFLWTGLEYFRSELYYLKFSWMNIGYAFAGWQMLPMNMVGMYGIGFLAATGAAMLLTLRWIYWTATTAALVAGGLVLNSITYSTPKQTTLRIAGIQMEFPTEREIPEALDQLLARYPEADLLVLSEYTLDGPVPESLKHWCKLNRKHLIVGGKDPAPNGNFYDTGFVVGPVGEIVFKQGKRVPIPFFKDGLPAPEQALWDSPWGKIGICICYDLSFTRVTDRLTELGAQLLIVPTMDLVDWGKRQHELHALVAPVRAAEYGLPIFRLASSGISQAVNRHGQVVAQARFPGEHETLFAELPLGGAGTLPLDRLLAPVSVGITSLTIGALVYGSWTIRRGKHPGTTCPDSSPEPVASPLK